MSTRHVWEKYNVKSTRYCYYREKRTALTVGAEIEECYGYMEISMASTITIDENTGEISLVNPKTTKVNGYVGYFPSKYGGTYIQYPAGTGTVYYAGNESIMIFQAAGEETRIMTVKTSQAARISAEGVETYHYQKGSTSYGNVSSANSGAYPSDGIQ